LQLGLELALGELSMKVIRLRGAVANGNAEVKSERVVRKTVVKDLAHGIRKSLLGNPSRGAGDRGNEHWNSDATRG